MNKITFKKITDLVNEVEQVEKILLREGGCENVAITKEVIFQGTCISRAKLQIEKKVIAPFLQERLNKLKAELKELGYEGDV